MTCIVPNCERPRKCRLGYCLMHYKRWKRHGDPLIVKKMSRDGTCQAPGCERPVLARGYCGRHVQRLYKNLPLDECRCLLERLWSFVDTSGDCWLWTGTVAGRYGQFHAFGKQFPAHRMVYELYVGAIPSNRDTLVCHRCDTPLCVRPEHLFLGTPSDNMRDMTLKGRHPKQQSSYRSKLTAEQVLEIRESTEAVAALAKRYEVADATISAIRNGKAWKSLQ